MYFQSSSRVVGSRHGGLRADPRRGTGHEEQRADPDACTVVNALQRARVMRQEVVDGHGEIALMFRGLRLVKTRTFV